ncbi:MAG: anaerobic ribonucleoside-triphosphate reductase activating protein [Bacteroidales bacterium]|nr:anaerobic ribonucleoside-triphosphate reductase activating protein [Bacteroidales bacterium]
MDNKKIESNSSVKDKNLISIMKIVEDTIVDGPGFRVSIYSAGCSHHCKNCHNPQSWNINNGTLYSLDNVLERILSTPLNVTFTGGDPFFQIDAFTVLAKKIKQQSNKNIWCYTGYLFEDILNDEVLNRMLPFIDVLVDGRFVDEEKDMDLLFRGSKNQRIIDVKKSLTENNVVEFNYNPFPEF